MDTSEQAPRRTPRGDLLSVLVAGAMALVLPGFGQLANGQPNRAGWVFVAFCTGCFSLVSFASLMVPDRFLVAAVAASLLLAAGAWLVGILDALWQAWREPRPPRPWQTVPLYLAVLFFAYVVVFKLGGGYLRSHVVEPFRIPSQSMAPGILRGDFLYADKRVNCPGCARSLRHGEVVLFIYPDNRNLVFIKRLVGLPGDRIEINGTSVRRNGQLLSVREEDAGDGRIVVTEQGAAGVYEVQWTHPGSERAEFTVPHGEVFVMGDNRNQSQDSRLFGPIPLANVIGVARQVWLSVDERLSLRWQRMGRSVR